MFSTVESGYFKNGASYFINGGLQDKSLDDVISIIQHESVHYQIFHCSSLGMYLLMCEKISKVDYSRDDILLELRRYYKRMQEELATYIEMVRYLLQHGYEKFIEEVNRMKYDNKEYYSYFKKISCRNDKLGILKLKTYEPEKLVSLIRCLLRVGIDAFNIEIGVLKFEEIQSPIDLQRKMSNERFLFNPNRRYKELVKTIMFKDGEFQYNNQSISVAPLDTYTIQEYIEMVQRNYPENKVVQSRLKSLTDWINHFNHTNYSKKRIHRIMKKLDIHAVIRKKKKKYKTVKPEETAENKLARNFYTTAPNKKMGNRCYRV